MNSNFSEMGKKCNLNDIDCWKQQLSTQFNCKIDDPECWKKLMNTLPC